MSVPKTDSGRNNGYAVVQRRLTILRRNNQIPYGWITDSTRRGYHTDTFDGPADFLQQMAHLYRSDLWSASDCYAEVWCESRSIAGVIDDVCEELAVSLYPSGGFSSLSLAYQSAQYIKASARQRPIKIIYVGDYDPAGVLIDQNIEREIRGHLPNADIEFMRIAITAEQIEGYDLPTKPRKPGDRRARHIKETVEAEAMPVPILQNLLRQSVESYLPQGQLDVIRAAEESERDGLKALGHSMDVGDIYEAEEIVSQLIDTGAA